MAIWKTLVIRFGIFSHFSTPFYSFSREHYKPAPAVTTLEKKSTTLTQKHQNDRISPQEPASRISNNSQISTPHPPNSSTHILLMNRSLFTGLPFLPALFLGVSVHISFTFSSTILQCLSNALTRASSFLLLRHEIRTWVCDRTAVWRMESGPEVNSCSSSWAISNSLWEVRIS